MPRKKTIELPPIISSFEVDGEVIVLEIPHPEHKEMGKGSYQKNEACQKLQLLIDRMYEDFFNSDGSIKRPSSRNDYLESGVAFAKKAEEYGFGSPDGTDDSSLRKTYYPEIKKLFLEGFKIAKNRKL